jgi:hypothetical protein
MMLNKIFSVGYDNEIKTNLNPCETQYWLDYGVDIVTLRCMPDSVEREKSLQACRPTPLRNPRLKCSSDTVAGMGMLEMDRITALFILIALTSEFC